MNIRNEKEILKNRLELLIEQKKDSDYKLSETKQAELMDIPYQTFHKYVKGTAECSISNLAKIAKYYEVSTDYLLGLTNIKSTDNKLQVVHEITGLSEDAIYSIQFFNKCKETLLDKKIVDCFIQSDHFVDMILGISGIITNQSLEDYIDGNYWSYHYGVTEEEVFETRINKDIHKIIDEIREKLKEFEFESEEAENGEHNSTQE